jgi:hypothetical protein
VNKDVYGIPSIRIKKSMDFETFYDKYTKAVERNPNSTFLIHFRVATHGMIDEYNCHPFKINKGQAFIHNGIIPNMPNEGKEDHRSDTRIYKDRVLCKLPRGWESNPAIQYMIEATIGSSKLAVLNIDNSFVIFKEESGHWADGVWYSNNSYSYKPITTSYSNEYWKSKRKWYSSQVKEETKEESRIFGLATQRAKKLDELIECEWCSEYLAKSQAKRINVDGVEVVCCNDCATMLDRDELFTTSSFTPILI